MTHKDRLSVRIPVTCPVRIACVLAAGGKGVSGTEPRSGEGGSREDQEPESVRMVCRRTTFRPVAVVNARWLDAHRDYELVRAMWANFMELSCEEWRSFWEQGYEYCGIIDNGLMVARAAVWRYSDDAWELASVETLPECRRRGLATEVCSLATSRIVGADRIATCNIRIDNIPMQRTAAAIGFDL